MSATAYKRRIVERELRSLLESAGAVVIEGPKVCGKTVTAETVAASEVRLDIDEQARRAVDARRKPGSFILTGSAVTADDVTRHIGAGRLARPE